MRWFKIHASITLIIMAGWCLYDATLRNEHGWIVAMAMVTLLSIENLRDAIWNTP